jgi:alkylation response protein AidB-like acyl-CoA dehydrogenase
VDLTPTAEQLEIVESSAAFLRNRLPVTRTRELFDAESNVDAAAWLAAADLGWFALGLSEAHGGIGCGLAHEALLFREIGRSLASGPFLSTLLAARVAAFAGLAALAASIMAGQRVGLAIPGSHDLVGIDGVVDGVLQLFDAEVENQGNATGLVLIATSNLAVLVRFADLHDVSPVPCIDPAVRLHRAVARAVTPIAAVRTEVDPIARRGSVLTAAMLTGITEAVRDIAAEHAKNRFQFDRPIGVNQGIKHPCADMAVQAELALAQTLFAALATDEGREDAEFHALSAHLVASHAAESSAAATVQILGGMGFTFEHDAQLYVKRAYVLSHVFGGTGSLLNQLLALPSPR